MRSHKTAPTAKNMSASNPNAAESVPGAHEHVLASNATTTNCTQVASEKECVAVLSRALEQTDKELFDAVHDALLLLIAWGSNWA